MLSINRIHCFQTDEIDRQSLASRQIGPQLQELAYEVIDGDEWQGNPRVTLQSYCTTGRGWLLPRLQVQYTIEENQVYSDCDVKPYKLFSVGCCLTIVFWIGLVIVGPIFTINELGCPWFMPVWGGFISLVMLVWCRYLVRRALNKLITNQYTEQIYIRFAINETATKG